MAVSIERALRCGGIVTTRTAFVTRDLIVADFGMNCPLREWSVAQGA